MDFWQDSWKDQFYHITVLFDVPDYVKSASIEDERPKLPLSSYALEKKFPLNTRPHTWLSATYYLMNKNKLSSYQCKAAETKIREACGDWGIDFDALQAQYKKAKTSDVEYLLEENHEGEKIQLFPISSSDDLPKAARYLFENRTKLPYRWRHKVASEILSRAKDIPLPYDDYLYKAAGYGVSDAQNVAHNFMLRAELVYHPEAKKLMRKCAADIWSEKMDRKTLKKYAEIMAQIDEQFRLTHRYERDLPMPESLFEKTSKEASERLKMFIELPNKKVIDGSIIGEKVMDKIAEAIGGRFEEIYKTASIFPGFDSFKEAVGVLDEKGCKLLVRMLPRPERDKRWKSLYEEGWEI